LVRQQLDSFDEFIQNTMQEIVDESPDIDLIPEAQYTPGKEKPTMVRVEWMPQI
jgi:DNA-directed RNA polymerase II subunit RPB2